MKNTFSLLMLINIRRLYLDFRLRSCVNIMVMSCTKCSFMYLCINVYTYNNQLPALEFKLD